MKIVIDGLIGSGKSTQVALLSEISSLPVVKEPIQDWPLKLFYDDPGRWGFLMQMAVLNSYLDMEHVDGIFERCPESTKQVFWKNLVDGGVVTDTENVIFSRISNKLTWNPTCFIYLDKKPELCYEHIKTRFQEGDSKISLEYLQTLKRHYDAFISGCDGIHVVDANRDIDAIHADIVKIIKPILVKDTWSITNVLM